jgi:hypothetical protein
MKKCYKCKEIKYELEFYKNKSRYDGLQHICKLCKKQLGINYYNTLNGKNRIISSVKKYQHTPKGKISILSQIKKYSKKNPEKVYARNIVLKKVYYKKIIKPSICSICNKEFPKKLIHGHHSDYSKPLDVIWVCAQCHVNIHRKVI